MAKLMEWPNDLLVLRGEFADGLFHALDAFLSFLGVGFVGNLHLLGIYDVFSLCLLEGIEGEMAGYGDEPRT